MSSDRGCPEGMYPLDLTYDAETYETFEDLRKDAEASSGSLNLPLSWYFTEEDPKWEEEKEFQLVFLMPRKYGNTWGMKTSNFDRAEVEQWLDTWLRGEIYHWFGWSPKIVKVTKSGPNPADVQITDDEIGRRNMTDIGITRRDDCFMCGTSRKEMARLVDIEFEHQGCAGLREKDNQYLIEQRDILQTRINRALNELTLVDGKRAAKARDILLGFS